MCLKLLPHLNSRSLLSSRTRHRSEGFVTALTCGVWWWWQFQKNCESPNRLLSNLHMGRTLYTSSLHIAIPESVQDFCGSSASSWPLSVNVCTLLPFVSETHLPTMSAVNTQDGPLNCKTNQDIVMFHLSMQKAI